MYRVGTVLRVKEAGFGARGCNGKIAIVTEKKSDHGLVEGRGIFNIKLADKTEEIWSVSKGGQYEVLLKSNREYIKPRIGKVLFTFHNDETIAMLEDTTHGVAVRYNKNMVDDRIGMIISLCRALNIPDEKVSMIADVLFDDIKNTVLDKSTMSELYSKIIEKLGKL